MTVECESFQEKGEWKVRLTVQGRSFVSHPYENKSCADASVVQQFDMFNVFESGRGSSSSWASYEAYLDKLVPWFNWEELEMTKEKQMFKIKSEVVFDKCSAMRCQNDPVGHADAAPWGHPGLRVPLCERHLKEAGVVTAEGETISTETTAAPAPASSSTAITGKNEAESFVKVMLADLDETIELLDQFVIETQDDLETAADILKDVKGKAKEIEAQEKSITKPINALLTSARDIFRPAKKALEKIEEVLKKKLADAHDREVEENKKALEAAAQAHAAGDTEAMGSAISQVKHTGELNGIGFRHPWTYKVVNASVVPREFLAINDKAVRDYIKAAGENGPEPVAGIEFFQETGVSARAN